ncbi:MAG: NAD(P)/FAD-dependent oxidoreductase [Planctomycetaceae bacterium]
MHSHPPKIALIGAGISGLACASKLRAIGCEIMIFEKSRGVGGRIATRRGEEGLTFDHGAQYFTARDPQFLSAVESWQALGLVEKWQGQIVSLTRGTAEPLETETDRYVGVPGMTSFARHLSKGMAIAGETRVGSIRRSDGHWEVMSDREVSLGHFDWVHSCAPPLQTGEIFRGHTSLTEKTDRVQMQPCWAILLELSQPSNIPYDGAFVQESPLSWIARNSSKPQRRTSPETWVLHASPEWSQENLEQPADEVKESLLAAFHEATGHVTTGKATAHRWRYSRPATSLTESYLLDSANKLGACGDWCNGSRVEGAFLSGLALAEQLQNHFASDRKLALHESR